MGKYLERRVYNRLTDWKNNPDRSTLLETPAFATLGNGEIDFYVKGIKSQKTYAVEVKAGKQSSRTIGEVLEKKKQILSSMRKAAQREEKQIIFTQYRFI